MHKVEKKTARNTNGKKWLLVCHMVTHVRYQEIRTDKTSMAKYLFCFLKYRIMFAHVAKSLTTKFKPFLVKLSFCKKHYDTVTKCKEC